MQQSDSSGLAIKENSVKQAKPKDDWTGKAEIFQTWCSTRIGFAASYLTYLTLLLGFTKNVPDYDSFTLLRVSL